MIGRFVRRGRNACGLCCCALHPAGVCGVRRGRLPLLSSLLVVDYINQPCAAFHVPPEIQTPRCDALLFLPLRREASRPFVPSLSPSLLLCERDALLRPAAWSFSPFSSTMESNPETSTPPSSLGHIPAPTLDAALPAGPSMSPTTASGSSQPIQPDQSSESIDHGDESPSPNANSERHPKGKRKRTAYELPPFPHPRPRRDQLTRY